LRLVITGVDEIGDELVEDGAEIYVHVTNLTPPSVIVNY